MLMDDKTLLKNIKDFFTELPITMQDLKNPTPEFTMRFYKTVLIELHCDLTALQMIQNNQLEKFSSSDMYQDLVPNMNLCKIINYILQQGGTIHEFGLNDLLAPTPKRNCTLMSNIMNILFYADTKVTDLEPLHTELVAVKVEYQNLKQKRDDLKKRINQMATEKVRKRQEKIELQEQVATLEEKLNEMTDEFNKIKSVQKEEKNKLKSEEEGFEKANYQMKQLTEELEELRAQIVSSPEEFQGQYERLVEQKNKLKEKVDNLREQIEPKKSTNEKLISHISAQETRKEELQHILEMNQQIQELKSEIEMLKKKHECFEEHQQEFQVHFETLKKNVENGKATLTGLQAQWKEQEHTLSNSLELAQSEYNETLSIHDEFTARMKTMNQEINELEIDIKTFENKISKMLTIASELKNTYIDIQKNQKRNAKKKISDLQNMLRKL